MKTGHRRVVGTGGRFSQRFGSFAVLVIGSACEPNEQGGQGS